MNRFEEKEIYVNKREIFLMDKLLF